MTGDGDAVGSTTTATSDGRRPVRTRGGRGHRRRGAAGAGVGAGCCVRLRPPTSRRPRTRQTRRLHAERDGRRGGRQLREDRTQPPRGDGQGGDAVLRWQQHAGERRAASASRRVPWRPLCGHGRRGGWLRGGGGDAHADVTGARSPHPSRVYVVILVYRTYI